MIDTQYSSMSCECLASLRLAVHLCGSANNLFRNLLNKHQPTQRSYVN